MNSEIEYEYVSDSESEESESEYGFSYEKERYQSIKRFDQLLKINIDFLENKIDGTYYYAGPFGNCKDHEPRRPYLVNLHKKYKLYTIDGQPNLVSESLVQNSYLEFITMEKIGKELIPLLLNHPDLYTCISTRHYQKDNFPSNKFNLTKTKKQDEEWNYGTNWHRYEKYHISETQTPYPNINKILKLSYLFFIVVKDPTTCKEADEILLDVLKSIN